MPIAHTAGVSSEGMAGVGLCGRAVMTNNQSYPDVLSTAPRLVLFGTLAMFAGDISNNYVLAKMKVWTNGRYMSARFVLSTLCGQFVNTAVFHIFALWGIMPKNTSTSDRMS